MDELRKPPASERFDLMAHHLLDAQEAAQILRMDRRTLIVWARLGYVPAHPLGEGKKKMWRFLEHELLEWVAAQESDKKRPPTSTIKVAISAHARRTA
jgi:Helix-turn-helix domain